MGVFTSRRNVPLTFEFKHFWVIPALALYFFFSLLHLNLPGLQYDEMLFVNGALGNIDHSFVAWEISIFGTKIPLMLMPHIGALKALIYSPIFSLFGTSPTTARLPVILVGSATVLFSYLLAKRALGRQAALWSSFLLATDPSFIYANKLDWGPVSLMLLLQVLSLYLLWRWQAGSPPRYLYFAAFFLGLGLYNKVIFAWFLTALLVSLLVCYWKELRLRLNIKLFLLAFTAFLLGCLPLIAYNTSMPLKTFAHRAVVTSDWQSAISQRLTLFKMILDGSAIFRVVNQSPAIDPRDEINISPTDNKSDAIINAVAGLPTKSGLLPYAFGLALISISLLMLAGGDERRKELFFFLLLFFLTVVSLCMTAEAVGPHHAIAIYPLPHILTGYLIARAHYFPWRLHGKQLSSLKFFSIIFGVAVILTQLIVDARYVRSFVVRGGTDGWSDAIYKLNEFAKKNPERRFVLMDWGFSTQLLLLSHGQIKKDEVFGQFKNFTTEAEKTTRLNTLLAPSEAYLVFHTPQFENFPAFDLYKRTLEANGLEDTPVKTFYQRDGRPIYVVRQISKPSQATAGNESQFYYSSKAEAPAEKSDGEEVYRRGGLYDNNPLGNSWGTKHTDYIAHNFIVPTRVSAAQVQIRYALGGEQPKRLSVFLDGELLDAPIFSPTWGYGNSTPEWKLRTISIGQLAPGDHQIKLTPAIEDQLKKSMWQRKVPLNACGNQAIRLEYIIISTK